MLMQHLGELFAWMIGWLLIVEYLFAASTVSVGWSGYVVSLLGDIGTNGIHIPTALTTAPIIYDEATNGFIRSAGGIINLPAMFIVFILTIILVVGVKESARFNNIIVFIKVTVILIFLVAGVWFISTANWHPFIPANTGKFGSFGISGILRGAAVIFFAYIGFDAVSTAAQESKESSARSSDRNSGFTCNLYSFIYSCCTCSYRNCFIYKTWCS